MWFDLKSLHAAENSIFITNPFFLISFIFLCILFKGLLCLKCVHQSLTCIYICIHIANNELLIQYFTSKLC